LDCWLIAITEPLRGRGSEVSVIWKAEDGGQQCTTYSGLISFLWCIPFAGYWWGETLVFFLGAIYKHPHHALNKLGKAI